MTAGWTYHIPRQLAQYLFGYFLWTLGVGSILYPVLLDAKAGHACSYGLGGWPAALMTAMALGIIGFPAVLLLARAAIRWADQGPFGNLALRLGLASVPLVGIGIASAVLVSTDTWTLLDPASLADPLFLAPILIVPLYLAVLVQTSPITPDSHHTHQRIALLIFAVWAAITLGLGLFLYVDMLGSSSWLVDSKAAWFYRAWGMMYFLAGSLYILGLTSRPWRPLATSFGWGFGATALTIVPMAVIVLGFLAVHEVYCAD